MYIGIAKVLPIIDVLGYDGQNSSFSSSSSSSSPYYNVKLCGKPPLSKGGDQEISKDDVVTVSISKSTGGSGTVTVASFKHNEV